MFVASVLEGEGNHRGERPPEPRDRRDREEKEAGMPQYLARQWLLGHCCQVCRSRIHQKAPLPERTEADVARRILMSVQRERLLAYRRSTRALVQSCCLRPNIDLTSLECQTLKTSSR